MSDRDRQPSLFEYGMSDPEQAALLEFDEDAPESTKSPDADPSSPSNPQGDGADQAADLDLDPDPTPDADDAPKYRSDRPRVTTNPVTGNPLGPCPWCYSDYLVAGGRGVACGDCSASIPTATDWYQRGDVVGIDF